MTKVSGHLIMSSLHTKQLELEFGFLANLLRLQMIKAIIDSRSLKSLKLDEPRRVQVLDLYCLTRFESESSSREIVY